LAIRENRQKGYMNRLSDKSAHKANFRRYYVAAATLGALSVALGAFGAHTLRGIVSETALTAFSTGTRYQMIHALAMLFAIHAAEVSESRWFVRAAQLFASGIVLFSGSLYGLVVADWTFLGPVTPIGGVALIAGWMALIVGYLKGYAPNVRSSGE